MQITERKLVELKKELNAVSTELEQSLIEQGRAADLGDLRENEEYATAIANSARLSNRKLELEKILDEATVVPSDNSPRISIGSVIDVVRLNKDGTDAGEARRFTLETSGDTVIKKIIGVDSPLGREILNGVSGIYTVQNNGGIKYRVTIVLGD